MRRFCALTAAAAVLSLAAMAGAQAPAATEVRVTVGPKLAAKATDLGPQELSGLQQDLHDQVQTALSKARSERPVSVDLVIEDAVPNRPTLLQMERTVSLSYRSIGLGGARVSGTATYADGRTRPIKQQYYETDLRNDRGFGTWGDADIAFGQVAHDISHDRLPDRYVGPGAQSSGHFGQPFSQQ